jgi:5-bromo-4-chloroindolyl phosphate hydrolysis protein
MNKNSLLPGIVAGVTGGLMLLVSFFSFHIQFFISLILGAAGYTGSYIIMAALKPKRQLEFKFNEITPELLESTLQEGKEKTRLLQGYAKNINDPDVLRNVEHLTDVINKIYENFKKDPKDIKVARQFLSYYFDSTLKIVKMYSELSSQKIRTPEITEMLLKAERMLNSIGTAYEKLLARLLADDIMDLDVEIETLEKTFKAENLK